MTLDAIMRLAVACFFVASTIFFAETARSNKWVSGERARKLIHIFIGIWGAWLPLWLGWRSIIVLGIMLFIGVVIANRLKLFKSIHSVARITAGEYLFPLTMVILAIYFKNDVIFAAAMLQLGISDGLAAVVGTRYGRKSRFKVLGHTKSIHGTVTFFVSSFLILMWALSMLNPGLTLYSPATFLMTIGLSLSFSAVLTTAELTGINGLDNLSVPLLTATGLYLLSLS